MGFRKEDVVEHTFNTEKSLGIVTEVIDSQSIHVKKSDGRGFTWATSQCRVLVRNGEWIVTVEFVEGTPWDVAFESATEQLRSAGVDRKTIAFFAFHFGRRFPRTGTDAEGFATLVDELRAEGFEVKVRKPEVSLAT